MSAKETTGQKDLFICTVTFLPLRSAPSHKAEMVSQVLFGERFKILFKSGSWLKISTDFDSYEGWIDSLHGGYSAFHERRHGVITGHELICTFNDGSCIIIAPASELFNLSDNFDSFSIGDQVFRLAEGPSRHFSPSISVIETALQYLNAPYLWGGRTPWGIDCSGFVQVVYKMTGIALPRDASQQAVTGDIINFLSDAKPGDILFFSGEGDALTHTGILLSQGKIIHASGTVRIDKVDHQGIWNEETGRYTHRLRVIRRMKQ